MLAINILAMCYISSVTCIVNSSQSAPQFCSTQNSYKHPALGYIRWKDYGNAVNNARKSTATVLPHDFSYLCQVNKCNFMQFLFILIPLCNTAANEHGLFTFLKHTESRVWFIKKLFSFFLVLVCMYAY